eukprot:226110-Pleurochrysis_carterae.AAC.3
MVVVIRRRARGQGRAYAVQRGRAQASDPRKGPVSFQNNRKKGYRHLSDSTKGRHEQAMGPREGALGT